MGSAGRAKFEREYVYSIHASRMQRVLLETAGIALDDEPETAGDMIDQQPRWADVAGSAVKADKDAVTV